ncbi:sugar transferase [Clostridium perfringens]|uniref:sugar transferase n=1 Tax=Clostridium perfringens TaxID=1502 RepID=UPI0018A9E7D0|nr:sugar transferase [Clostridium perfringens]EJT5931357.1 sugar transferase [Clostridium perfringens]EJT6162619.1 sugar transferase [Clostridium perfringens]EJT6505105.1 sugar transferase [Clostridium perfringens]HEF0383878.1 sugar transferase [Clostridium perfringens]
MELKTNQYNLSLINRFLKRTFDITFSLIGLVVTGWVIIIFYFLIKIFYKESGFFKQNRVGRDGKIFKIVKLKSMRNIEGITTTVTVDGDPRITPIGKFIRKTKIDELPQLYNVLIGDMSFVGPRPDVEELINSLPCNEKNIYLSIRPGITGPATLKYKNEEDILAKVKNPEKYNKDIIFNDKVNINIEYIKNYSFIKDIKYIFNTIL